MERPFSRDFGSLLRRVFLLLQSVLFGVFKLILWQVKAGEAGCQKQNLD